MFIVLPPSETKTRPAPPTQGPHVGSELVSFPELAAPRKTMLNAAIRTAHMRGGAGKLGIPASAPELLTRMQALESEPAAPPLEVYSGVLYEALGHVNLDSADASRTLAVTSALYGLVDCARDVIPAYRLSAGSELWRLGKAGTWWKKHLAALGDQLTTQHGVIVDCRSGSYRSMMPLRGDHVLAVTPVLERGSTRTVVSHDAKKYRGLVARVLMQAPIAAASTGEVMDQLRAGLDPRLGVEIETGGHATNLVIVDRGK